MSVIQTDDNIRVFEFLRFLSKAPNMVEIESYKELEEGEKRDILSFLEGENYGQWVTKQEINRLESFVNSFPAGNFQNFNETISDRKVCIIGLGTAGSYLIDTLRKIGFSYFYLIDGDAVEASNLLAQNYQESELGQSKSIVLSDKYMGDTIQIETINQYVSSFEELSPYLESFTPNDFIINAADDYALMENLALNYYQGKLRIPIIECGYGVLKETVYLINNRHIAKMFIKRIKELKNVQTRPIVSNSGSILNAYSSALFVAKLILDQLLGIPTEYFHFNLFSHELSSGRIGDLLGDVVDEKLI